MIMELLFHNVYVLCFLKLIAILYKFHSIFFFAYKRMEKPMTNKFIILYICVVNMNINQKRKKKTITCLIYYCINKIEKSLKNHLSILLCCYVCDKCCLLFCFVFFP